MKKVSGLIRGTAVLGVGSWAEPLLEKREKGRTPISANFKNSFRFARHPQTISPQRANGASR